jgi:uncharacterized membrane protein
MKRVFQFLRVTLAGGILFLVPIIVVAIILGRALGFAHHVVDPLASHIPVQSVIGLRTPKILAVVAIILFCFLAGCIARTMLARHVVNWLDSAILSNLPGYEFFKGVGESVLGVEQQGNREVVLVRFDDNSQIGFLLDRLDNGLVAVYIPGAPNPHSGGVYFMTADRVTPIDAAPQATLKCLKRLGAGANALLGKLPIEANAK